MIQATTEKQTVQLCHLHPQIARGGPGTGVQQSARPAGGGRGIHRQPAPRGLAGAADRLDERNVSFVSVTEQFNTSTSMGRLTLNILLSFAQFEREIIGERIRDKKLASAMKGKYLGGQPIMGYDVDREKMRLLVNPEEAELCDLL